MVTELFSHTHLTLPLPLRAREFGTSEDQKWVEEFEKEQQQQHASHQKDLSSVAKEMTETVTDPAIKATEVGSI